jgi:hypothetical protein
MEARDVKVLRQFLRRMQDVDKRVRLARQNLQVKPLPDVRLAREHIERALELFQGDWPCSVCGEVVTGDHAVECSKCGFEGHRGCIREIGRHDPQEDEDICEHCVYLEEMSAAREADAEEAYREERKLEGR